MKVDKNQLVPNVEIYSGEDDSGIGYFGIPVRLEIAARLLPAFAEDVKTCADPIQDTLRKRTCKEVFKWADALIAAHNETCEAPKC